MMNYKELMGYNKTTKKKVVKEQKKSTIVDNIKQELNEWTDETFRNKPKRWTKSFGGSGLTEYEEKLSEGPAYEYEKVLKSIERAENQQAKEINNLVKLLGKKGLKREATNLAHSYMTNMREFNNFMKKLMSKLVSRTYEKII